MRNASLRRIPFEESNKHENGTISRNPQSLLVAVNRCVEERSNPYVVSASDTMPTHRRNRASRNHSLGSMDCFATSKYIDNPDSPLLFPSGNRRRCHSCKCADANESDRTNG